MGNMMEAYYCNDCDQYKCICGHDDFYGPECLSDMEVLDYNLGVWKWWLTDKERQLNHAKHVFSGRELSTVILDPVGFKFPKEFYGSMLRYEPGQGLVPSRRNPNYLGGVA